MRWSATFEKRRERSAMPVSIHVVSDSLTRLVDVDGALVGDPGGDSFAEMGRMRRLAGDKV